MTLIEQGHEVFISMPKSSENTYFSDLGCNVIETHVDRRGVNPIMDLKLIVSYLRIMKKIRPDIIFSYTIKPNIYGSIISNLLRIKQVSNVTGTGATFLKNDILSKLSKVLYKISIRNSYKVFFQNSGDKEFFVKNGMVNDNYSIIPGSGVNLDHFELCDLPKDKSVNFIFIGRVMKVKGIDQYLEAAKKIKGIYPNTHFYIAGFIEDENYKKIIDSYHIDGIVEYIGFQKDIKSWIQKCHCTVLPSFGGEGVPNVLLESAAMGRICIASRIYGSKDVIIDGVTGYLFDSGSSESLIEKMKRFLELNYEAKRQMGLEGRRRVEREFDRQIVIREYLKEVERI